MQLSRRRGSKQDPVLVITRRAEQGAGESGVAVALAEVEEAVLHDFAQHRASGASKDKHVVKQKVEIDVQDFEIAGGGENVKSLIVKIVLNNN